MKRIAPCLVCFFLLLAGCGESPDGRSLAGYVEGEYVHVASPLPGRLESLSVTRGGQVKAGDALFKLESVPEEAGLTEATERVAGAKATVADLRKGKRPSEVAALRAQLREAEAALAFADQELARQIQLLKQRSGTVRDRDSASTTLRRDQEQVEKLKADIETAEMGARSDQIAAAEAELAAREAEVARAQWDLAQKSPVAPATALVFDTVYEVGEWVPAGQPVVVLLPPENVKVRVFVPESLRGQLRIGGQAVIAGDGLESTTGTVAYLAPQAEYTPPVLYSRENRARLVYLVELAIDPAVAARYQPGQPVEVRFGPMQP